MVRRSAPAVVALTCAASALVLGALPSSRAPQTPSAPQTPVFTGQVDVVRLDVTVLGKDRLPVRGLTLDDFSVKVDGQPQKLVALHEVDLDDPPPPPAAWMRDVTPDVTTNAGENDRLVAIVVDDALIPLDPAIVRNAKAAVDKIVDRLGPHDLAAMIFTSDSKRAVDFTHDRTALRAAMTGLMPGLATWQFNKGGAGTNSDVHYYLSSLKVLEAVADRLMSVSDRRKALIWISPGIPVDSEMLTPLPQMTGVVGDDVTGVRHVDRTEISATGTAFDEMGELFRAAQRANVAIYPIDPCGLGGLEVYVAHEVGEAPLIGAAASPISHRESRLSMDFIEAAAANTGGHAVVNTNDPTGGIAEIFKENGSYYLLGFTPSNPQEDGKLRRLDVKVDRPGVEVHTRSYYFAPKPAAAGAPGKGKTPSPENAALAAALANVVPSSDLPLGVGVAAFALPGQHTAAVTLVLGVSQPVPPEAATSKRTETTEFQINAFTPDGDARGGSRQTAHVVLRPGATGTATYDVLGRIDLAPGPYVLRLAAHNTTSRRTGSVSTTVVVPDFTNDVFSMSGVVVSRTPGRATAPEDLLTALVPIVPTADRQFDRGDRVDAFLRVYQSGKKAVAAVTLAVQIRNDHDGLDVNETDVMDVDRFVTLAEPVAPLSTRVVVPPGREPPRVDAFANVWLRAADKRYAVPLDRLAPGEHLLTFATTLGTTTLRRDVRFTVK